MTVRSDNVVFAAVSHEFGTAFVSAAAPVLTFGRGTGCEVRMGTQPLMDAGVPRLAGQLTTMGGSSRVVVENLAERLAFDVLVDGEPVQAVRPGALYGPGGRSWDVRVTGSQQAYIMRVEVLSVPRPVPAAASSADDGPVTHLEPDLTERQWAVLECYTAPIRAGGAAPATHAQVSNVLGWSIATVRIECGAIWNSFVLAGVPMRDFHDKRDAIADAATRHRLVP